MNLSLQNLSSFNISPHFQVAITLWTLATKISAKHSKPSEQQAIPWKSIRTYPFEQFSDEESVPHPISHPKTTLVELPLLEDDDQSIMEISASQRHDSMNIFYITFIYRFCWQLSTKQFTSSIIFDFVSFHYCFIFINEVYESRRVCEVFSWVFSRAHRIRLRCFFFRVFSCARRDCFSRFFSCVFSWASRVWFACFFICVFSWFVSCNSFFFGLCQILFISIFNDQFKISHRRLHRLRIERIWLIELRWL